MEPKERAMLLGRSYNIDIVLCLLDIIIGLNCNLYEEKIYLKPIENLTVYGADWSNWSPI